MVDWKTRRDEEAADHNAPTGPRGKYLSLPMSYPFQYVPHIPNLYSLPQVGRLLVESFRLEALYFSHLHPHAFIPFVFLLSGNLLRGESRFLRALILQQWQRESHHCMLEVRLRAGHLFFDLCLEKLL